MPSRPPTYNPSGKSAEQRERERKAWLDERRAPASERGYDAAWRRVRKQFVDAHPKCCEPGCNMQTEEVDHILSVRERPDLRLRWSNLRPYCRSHHSARTARDQSFGRSPAGGRGF